MYERKGKTNGHCELSDQEIELVNQVKELEGELGYILRAVAVYHNHDAEAAETAVYEGRTPDPSHDDIREAGEAARRAEDALKTGLMWLVRAITKPTSL